MLGKKTADQINAKISSVIGSDMVVESNIKAKEAVRVEGSVTGNVDTEGALIISSTGKVKGNVTGSNIIIGGSLEGDLCSGGRTEVASTGKVIGNIRTKSLIVDENAVFQGQCTMNAEGIAPASNVGGQDAKSGESHETNGQDSRKDDNKWSKK